MTDQYGVPELPEDQDTPPPGQDAQPTEQPEDSVLDGAGDFTSGEGLVAFAGMIILALWLIFDVILDEYGQGFVTLLLASIVVIVPRLSPETVAKFHPVDMIMKVAGYGFGLFLLFEVFFILDSGFPDGVGSTIGALLTFAAFAMAFMGARQIKL